MSTCRLSQIGTLCVLFTRALLGHAATPAVEFEVVSVKLAEPFTPALAQPPGFHIGTKISGTRVDISRMRLIDLIAQACGVKQNLIAGPSWLKTTQDIFNVDARMPEGVTK
jgi:uncharacterized protein (TIGR03435 family)